ncbi:methyl-CpG-binding domain protein 2-like [Oncorhynchus clarkii lewisi]|uniref:methyl-CpG-binding domain protein 2-like n=1 Tax=Oncorhynchus clarkii lewisi TaxID=490388 RepID=UPI0039B8D5E8
MASVIFSVAHASSLGLCALRTASSLRTATSLGLCALICSSSLGLCALRSATSLGLCALICSSSLGLCALICSSSLGLCALICSFSLGLCALRTASSLGLCALICSSSLGLCALICSSALGLCALICNSALAGKPDLNTALPIRQTASIFKQPVTKVVNHPSNKVKTDLQRATEQPRQLFWEKRLKGLRVSAITEEVLRSMELPKGLTSVGPDTSDETLLSAIASALHMSSSPITGQTTSAAEKNPAIWLNTSQPLCKAFIVTDQDIREQELKVIQARRTLEDALMADGLARTVESSRDSEDEAA